MAEPTLSLGRPELLAEIGDYLGLGRTSASWDSEDLDRVTEILKSGLRKFYYPDIVAPESIVHDWSFLHPEDSITTVVGDYDYDLPDNFGGFEGEEIHFPAGTGYQPVQIRPLGFLLQCRQVAMSGVPTFAAIRTLASDGSTGQRAEMLFYPTPSSIWVMPYHYFVNPEAVSAAAPYPLGGPAHAETIKACCKWAAEETLKDGQRVWEARAKELLRKSVMFDRTQNRPESWGYNGNGESCGRNREDTETISFEGVVIVP
jgi:hypothetical protein